MKKPKHRQVQHAGPRPAATAVRPTVDLEALARRVESALVRGEVDTACQLLSQARPSPESRLPGEVAARAYTLQAYERWDKPQRAIGSLERALEWAPESAELRRLHAALLRRAASSRRAVPELAEARRLAPGDPRIDYEALLTRLAAGDRGGDLPDLAAALEGATAPRARALLAALEGDLASAERMVATSEHPVDKLIHGVLLLARGEAAGALPSLERAAADKRLPLAAQAHAGLYLGIARARLRQLAPAAEALEKARALGAPQPQVQAQLAWVYRQLAIDAVLQSDLAAAAEWFGRLEELGGPEAAEAQKNAAYALGLLGQERARQGDYNGAASAWSRALAITPRDLVLRQNLAVALERAGKGEEAIPHWHEVVRQLPRAAGAEARREAGGRAGAEEEDLQRHVRALAHRHLADLYLEGRETGHAIDQLEKAVRIVPEDLDTRRGLASLLMDEGQAKKAAAHYQQVVAAAPDSAQDRLELGLALDAAGDDQRGVEQMQRALELQPDSPLVQSSLGLALTQRATRSPGAATSLEDARRAVKLMPSKYVGLALIALGGAQLARGDRQGAERSFKAAIRKAPTKAVAAARVGDACWRAGDRDAAVAAWVDATKRAKRAPGVYPDLVEAWAAAGDAGRCRECLEAAIKRPELWPGTLSAVERISRSRKLQPFLREVLRGMAESHPNLSRRVLLVRMLVYAGDLQGAGSLLSRVALQVVEEGERFLIAPILDLDMKYRLLSRQAALAMKEWLEDLGYWDEED